MAEKLVSVRGAISAFLGVVAEFLGFRGVLFLVLFVLAILDYVTGVAKAVKLGEWKSGKAREGVQHKIAMFIVVVVSGIMDLCLGLILGAIPEFPMVWVDLLFPLTLVWYIIGELGSILENAVAMGVKVPEWLRKALEVGQKAVDDLAEKEN